MLIHRRKIIPLLGAAMAMVMISLLLFYVGARRPLSSEEVDRYIARIESQPQAPGGRHDVTALRRFLDDDDGRPFYTVNLYDFHETAQYLDDQLDERTGQEAFDRFSEVMLRLLAERSSHPIFGSDWTDAEISAWDRIVIVRYRSRRDIAEIFASTEFAEASAHKWAALKRNDRLLVQALHFPELHLPVLLFALIGAAVFLLPRITSPNRSKSSSIDAHT
jgi:hypothetical protein